MEVREASAGYLVAADQRVLVGYKQTEVGAIPKDWKVVNLGAVARGIYRGASPRPIDDPRWFDEASNIGWVRISDVTQSGRYLTETTQRLSQDGVRHSRYVSSGALIMSICATVGRPIETRIDTCIHDGFVLFDQPSVEQGFLYHVLKELEPRWSSKGQTGSQMNLNTGLIKSTRIPLPPTKAEQEAIAEALSDADALIESLGQLLAKKRHLKQGAMQQLLTGKKRLPSFSGEWRKGQLGEVVTYCSSGATPYRGRPEYYKGTMKWITSGELNYNVITDTIEHISEVAVQKTNLKVHPAGTFLMAITGLEAAGTRGACGIVGSPATTNQSCMAIYPSSELRTEFLYHYYVLRGNELALQYCQGTKQQSYTAKLVRLLPIDLPPTVEEQTAIATILSDMDAELAALEAKLAKARNIKQGMMQELLTGRIRLV